MLSHPKILPPALAITFTASSVTSQHPRLASTTADVQFRELQIPNNKHISDKLIVKQSPLGGQPEFLLGNSVAGLGQWKSSIWNTTQNQHSLFCGSHDFKHLVDQSRESESSCFYFSPWLYLSWLKNMGYFGRSVTEKQQRDHELEVCLEYRQEIPAYSFLVLKYVYEERLFANSQK